MLDKPEAIRKQDPMFEDEHKELRREAGILCIVGFQFYAAMYILIHFKSLTFHTPITINTFTNPLLLS